MKLHLWLGLGAALAIGTWGIGGSVRAGGDPIADVDFLADAITHCACEVRASELALTRAQAKEVQQFARQVVVQQGKFRLALTTLARDNTVPVLANQQSGRGLAESRLAGVRADAFDQEFLQFLLKDLEQLIDLSQRCATGSGGVAERELAATMLPTLRQRLKEGQRLLATIRK